jgi:hypothetical protein
MDTNYKKCANIIFQFAAPEHKLRPAKPGIILIFRNFLNTLDEKLQKFCQENY